jgi:hypothetical protein
LTSEIPYEKGRGFRYYLDAVGGADAKEEKRLTLFTPMVRRMWRVHSCFHELSKGYSGSQIIVPETGS